ncbi:hypothetical protein ACET3Z_003572 [Daucus carota]
MKKKKAKQQGSKILPCDKKLLEIPEDCSLKVQIEPSTSFMEESLGDILKWMHDNIHNQCTRLPDEQSLWNNIDLGKDIAGGTFLDSGFGMDFSNEEMSWCKHNQETNTSSVTNTTSCIHKELEEYAGCDYLHDGLQGDLFWDIEQERLMISGLWEATDD